MRDIKFRGKDETGKWCYGGIYGSVQPHIIHDFGGYPTSAYTQVKPETIGQFTGAYDCHGVEIYECDICDVVGSRVYVAWDDYYFKFNFFKSDGKRAVFRFEKDYTMIAEVIGNIHDNPELFEGY